MVAKVSHHSSKSTRKKTAANKKSARPSGRRKAATRTTRKGSASKRWSQRVTRDSDALDLKQRVFALHDPKKIAASLKHSAEQSTRRKASPYRSAMSMLTFYINRAGKTLPKTQQQRLERAKEELKRQFHRKA